MKFKNIGGDGIYHALNADEVFAILDYKGSGVKKAVKMAEKRGDTIDLRAGAKCKAVIIMSTKLIFLSPHSAKLLLKALNKQTMTMLMSSGAHRTVTSPPKAKEEPPNESGNV